MIPYITEKTINLANQGIYTLLGSYSTDKLSAKKSCEKLFKVQVESIRCIKQRPLTRRIRRQVGQSPPHKKFLIGLKKGQKIPGFEVSQEKGQSTYANQNS